jgi:hypothetical protein
MSLPYGETHDTVDANRGKQQREQSAARCRSTQQHHVVSLLSRDLLQRRDAIERNVGDRRSRKLANFRNERRAGASRADEIRVLSPMRPVCRIDATFATRRYERGIEDAPLLSPPVPKLTLVTRSCNGLSANPLLDSEIVTLAIIARPTSSGWVSPAVAASIVHRLTSTEAAASGW